MQTFNIRTLEKTDSQALLAFETLNREWFESHIDPRPPAFYSAQGVADHIEGYLSGFALGTWHPFVIEDAGGEIVGRANLKDINPTESSAEVGYRIGQRHCAQGLATLALRHLIQEARVRWGLGLLVAYVYEGNVGSRKVLGRCGFLGGDLGLSDMAGDEGRFVLSI